MKVYELSKGEKYEGSRVVAIYATPERAILGAWEEAEHISNIYKTSSDEGTEWTISNERNCLFYIVNDLDEYIFVKEREVIE